MSSIKLLFGVPYPSFVSKEFQDVLEKYGVNELDTGASYVSYMQLYESAFADVDSLGVSRELATLALRGTTKFIPNHTDTRLVAKVIKVYWIQRLNL